MNFKRVNESNNLFDENTIEVGYLDVNTGVEVDNSSRRRSGYIAVDSSTYYSISRQLDKPSTSNFWILGYDENKNGIIDGPDSSKPCAISAVDSSTRLFTFQTTPTTKYIRWYVTANNSYSNIMLNSGSIPLPYEPYGNTWNDSHYIHNTATDTITTLPAVLYPTGTTATVGLKGQAVQSGTPTPDNPVTPEGCGERTGNLFDKAWFNNNTQLSLSTGLPIGYVGRIAIVNPIDVSNIDAVTLTYSLGATETENFMYSIFSGNTLIERVAGKKSGDIIDVTNADTLYICLYIGGRGITVNDVQWIMLNSGSTALPYEPYGFEISISSASTTTPVYLGDVQSTRRIRKYEFTGQESIALYNSAGLLGFQYLMGTMQNNMRTNGLCTHFIPQITGSSRTEDGVTFGASNQYLYFTFSAATISAYSLTDVESISSFLRTQYANGTPVTVWYILANPETAVINEPLMRIGDYADTLSNISIPVTAGGDTLSVGTTVQPSEVTVNYKGWHPVADVHEFTGNYTVSTMQTLPISELETHTISDLQGGEWS